MLHFALDKPLEVYPGTGSSHSTTAESVGAAKALGLSLGLGFTTYLG